MALGGFLAAAAFCTYLSRQIYAASLPVVETAEPFAASLRLNQRAQGRIVYEETVGRYAPAELKISEVYVQPGQTVATGDPILRADLLHLETVAEGLENQLLQNEIASKNGERQALLLQKQIAQLELELYRSRREQSQTLAEQRRQAEELSQSEQEAESALQLELALAALEEYENRSSVDSEDRALRRSILRIQMELDQPDLSPEETAALEEQLESARLDLRAYRRLPSYHGDGDSESERLRLELSILQAEHALLQSEEPEKRSAAQLLHELNQLEQEQSRLLEEQQAVIDEKKLELAILDYQNRIDALDATQGDATVKQNQELQRTLEAVRALIQADGILYSEQDGQLLSLEVQEGERTAGEDCLYKVSIPASACVRWEMESGRLEEGDPVSVFLSYWEQVDPEHSDERQKRERPSTLLVTARRWTGTGYEYTAAIPSGEEPLAMEEQEPVEVLIDKDLESYDTVVPVSAISFQNEHQGTLFYLAEEQGQLLSRQMTVEILGYDSDNAALKDSLYDEVILYSDRPLTSGGTVRRDG